MPNEGRLAVGHLVALLYEVCEAWPVRRKTGGYLPSRRTSQPCDWYDIMLLGDRGCRAYAVFAVVSNNNLRADPWRVTLNMRPICVAWPTTGKHDGIHKTGSTKRVAKLSNYNRATAIRTKFLWFSVVTA